VTAAVDYPTTALAPIRRREEVMGTVVSFDVRPGRVSREEVYLALAEARAGLHRADAVFSTWKPNSPVSRLRGGKLRLEDAPPDVAVVLELCAVARHQSRGWFDPWALPGGVDPTGLVKGWAARNALRRIEAAGVAGAMVNAGGDIALAGAPRVDRSWQIGVRDPWDATRVIAVLEVGAAIATSGAYERGAHVLNPRTGRPSSPIASATVTGPDLALADAFATGLLAAGEPGLDWIGRIEGYDGLIVRGDGSMVGTSGIRLVR
jgi:FAD:protein FMN transferase